MTSYPRFTKSAVQDGDILWLCRNADTIVPGAIERAGLDEGVLGHPCVVVDTLPCESPLLWIALVH